MADIGYADSTIISHWIAVCSRRRSVPMVGDPQLEGNLGLKIFTKHI